jgi:ComF family protein
MHQIKYKGQKDLGEFLGAWCGAHLKKNIQLISYDLIIPIPLFHKKFKERGYNQAACIAQGISQMTQIPYCENVLRRLSQSQSLVGQNRVSRYETLAGVFDVADPSVLEGKHVLLVDDTLTTGATFIAAAEKIKAAGASEISFLALAALK